MKPLDRVPSTGGAESTNALTVRNFRFLWFNNIAFFLVANAERFTYGWLVLEGLDRGEREQGLIVFTLGLPAVFITLHAGVWADRLDRRRLLMGTQLAGALVMAATALLVGSGRATLASVAVVTLVAGTAAAVGAPVRASLVPALVPREKLYSAIAINALAMTASMIVGPVLVRQVGTVFDFTGAFWFLAGLMVVGVGFLAMLDVPPHEVPSARRPVRSETMAALRHVWNDRALRNLFGLLVVASVTVNPAVMVTTQAHVKEALGRDSGDAAIALALMGAGIAVSSMVVMKKGDMANKGVLFQRAVIVGASMTFLIGRSTNLTMLAAFSFCMGLAGGFYITMNQGLIQSNTPQPLMGRVMALYALTQAGMMPLGALVLGVVSARVGTGNAISGAATVALAVFVWVYVRNAELRRLA
ncbi:MAG: MFS transporter [Acidimicrobiales bacterium]